MHLRAGHPGRHDVGSKTEAPGRSGRSQRGRRPSAGGGQGRRVALSQTVQEDSVARAPGLLRCWIEQYESASVVYARGEVDLSSAPLLRRCLERAEVRPRPIIVDLRSVTYLDGTGFRVLEEAAQRARDQQRSFWVIPSRSLRRLVTLLHLDDAVPLTGSIEEAMDRSIPPAGTLPTESPSD